MSGQIYGVDSNQVRLGLLAICLIRTRSRMLLALSRVKQHRATFSIDRISHKGAHVVGRSLLDFTSARVYERA